MPENLLRERGITRTIAADLLPYYRDALCFVPDLSAQQQKLNETEKQRRSEQEAQRQRAVQTGD